MSKPKILITTQMMIHEQPRFSKWLIDLGYDPEFKMNAQFLCEEDCLKLLPIYDGWIAGDDQITESVIKHLTPKLKIISKWGTGIDSINMLACKNNNIQVKNSPGAFADAVGEMAVAYLLSMTRGILDTNNKVRAGEWPKKQYKTLVGMNIGFLGLGAIGQAAALRLENFRSKIYYSDPNVNINKYSKVSIQELFSIADALIISASLNPSTKKLINDETLDLLKKEIFLVNVGRGSILDEKSLLKAIDRKKIISAALDVYEQEPLLQNNNLLKKDNIIFGSHNANNTFDAVEAVHLNTINQIHLFFNGEKN